MALFSRATYITTDNEATGVSIATWFLATTFIIMFLSRQSVRYVMLRRVQLDDYLMTGAMILSLGLSLAYSIAASHGMGNKVVSVADAHTIQKAYYAADLLYIMALCCVKLSLVIFFNNIAVDEKQKRVILGLGAFAIMSAISTLFAAALQCGGPRSWEVMTLHCFNQSAFWTAFGVLDMFTDCSIIVLSIMLVWDLRIPISRKAVVVGCFAPRVLVIAAAACRLAYLATISPHKNPAFNVWVSVICTEVQICLSISTACIPCIKPFFEGVESGVWQSDHLRRRGFSINDLYSKGYAKRSEAWTDSQRTGSVPKTEAEVQVTVQHVTPSEDGELSALPAFEGGKWEGIDAH
ncbi:uncharacterized protein BDZ99DRAFT_121327 [Mytilinidion resinicola]|uniref:Rhodopsin domain-containing protein n=1 Tax=Mytilinidion resinicola TaxID=574789 RepID=A0A6A6Z4G5_9PEZI|nr:uncharacterized protein BDZ99DRAFT_121327 [Mytilinidion resinicola]KAF2815718.1 hypothetical protein BDZ99DRAFT_121327 [Mytilinidion resinicola]